MTTLEAQATPAPVLEVGDVLLQSMSCYACSLIEAEEDSAYSHMGIVLSTLPEVMIAEAWGPTHLVALREFVKKSKTGSRLRVLRFRNPEVNRFLTVHQVEWRRIFAADFNGNAYDDQFLWNNFDERGREKFYCSELVTKLIATQIDLELPVKRMHFTKNRDAWARYFHGVIPDGKFGNSPGDFERSELFHDAGEI
ncbi:MAG: hypothetical protein H7222_07275 [Methylotenera sp.]|nr:hypothetical protein [Oligoflexia bacterium]